MGEGARGDGAATAASRPLHGAAVLLALALAACGADPDRTPHVLLVSVDTLRADHLASYGYARETAPALTRLAAEGARFANAYAQAPSTIPTHASLFTGRLPFEHGSYHVGLPLADDEQTLAETLRAAGYRTFGLASSVRFLPTPGFDQGLHQGFEAYEVHDGLPEAERSESVTTRALALMQPDGSERPWFGFVHYFDPHEPYAPPGAYRAIWEIETGGGPRPAPEATSEFLFRNRSPDRAVPPETLAWLRALYDGEIRYLDVQLERLFRAARELRDRPVLIVLTSDHGEEFKEHGGLSHGRALHEELLRVPLFAWWPGRIPSGRVVETPIQSVDVMPTILALVGVEPPPGLAGRSLAAALMSSAPEPAGGSGDANVVVGELRPGSWSLAADVAGRRWKLVQRDDVAVLHDLDADPGGHVDRAADEPETVARLRALADQVGLTRPRPSRTPEPVPEALRARLRALGYVEEADAAAQALTPEETEASGAPSPSRGAP